MTDSGTALVLILTVTWCGCLAAIVYDGWRRDQRVKKAMAEFDADSMRSKIAAGPEPAPEDPQATLYRLAADLYNSKRSQDLLASLKAGDRIETCHDYMSANTDVVLTFADGRVERFSIQPDDDMNLSLARLMMSRLRYHNEAAERKALLQRDAEARAKGLNLDGTPRRETVPKADAVAAARRQAEASLGTLDETLSRRIARRKAKASTDDDYRVRRHDDTYTPVAILPTIYDQTTTTPPAETARYAEPAASKANDDDMKGGGFTTGGSFGGESFSTGGGTDD